MLVRGRCRIHPRYEAKRRPYSRSIECTCRDHYIDKLLEKIADMEMALDKTKCVRCGVWICFEDSYAVLDESYCEDCYEQDRAQEQVAHE